MSKKSVEVTLNAMLIGEVMTKCVDGWTGWNYIDAPHPRSTALLCASPEHTWPRSASRTCVAVALGRNRKSGHRLAVIHIAFLSTSFYLSSISLITLLIICNQGVYNYITSLFSVNVQKGHIVRRVNIA